jgi:hypothetical protein
MIIPEARIGSFMFHLSKKCDGIGERKKDIH